MDTIVRAPLDRVADRQRADNALPPLPRGGAAVDRSDRAATGSFGATIKAYPYDPTGEKARQVKARYRGVCRGCVRRFARAARPTS
jgi:hypothetical protein